MSESRKLLFTVSSKDCKWDYYKGTGKGGQKRNKTENCVRCTHESSGAIGKSEEGRSKEKNKIRAFLRMLEKDEFKKWHKIEVSRKTGAFDRAEKATEKAMSKNNLKIEGQSEGKWVEVID